MNQLLQSARPVLLLDEQRCINNIRRMSAKTEKSGSIFRPHFKTHQSVEIAEWFRAYGVNGITVSSVSMARYFVDNGWNDITIAFPFFPAQLKELKELEKKSSLRLFIHTAEDLELLNDELDQPFSFYIEINPGFGRSGIHYKNSDLIDLIIKTSDKFDRTKFHGFYIHDGRTYQAKNRQEIISKASIPIHILHTLKQKFPHAVTSMGDTPSASVLEHFDGIDELTPGNFVFYDWMQVKTGSCTLNDVALFVIMPVAQLIGNGRAIVHGGAAHLSREYLTENNSPNFGQIIHYSSGTDIEKTDGKLIALSQEHGTVSYSDNTLRRGDSIIVCPVHSCLTANLFSAYRSTNGRTISKRILS